MLKEQVRTVLVVDDNRMYREAVRRNLEFVGYQIMEAEDKSEALERIQQQIPHMVITDLDMRTRSEGLELIKEVKARYPALPMILISAVGTFDEGALARQYGAMYVISKSRIDEEVENLYSMLDLVFIKLNKLEKLRLRTEKYLSEVDGSSNPQLEDDLNQSLLDPEIDSGIKSEVYEMLLQVRSRMLLQELEATFSGDTDLSGDVAPYGKTLLEEIPQFQNLHAETQTMLQTADRLLHDDAGADNLSVLRNVSFSFCFAVENEVKNRLGKKVVRFLGNQKTSNLISEIYDKNSKGGSLDLFFNQYIILTFQRSGLDLPVDITRQVLERMSIHRDKYKPDGLKALGVLVFCFGRTYEFQSIKGKNQVKNPLGLKGLEDDETLHFSSCLIRLQHLRNPYIHPEFSEREKIENIRQVAIVCMNFCSRLV